MEINDWSPKGMPCKVCGEKVDEHACGLRYTDKEIGNVTWYPHHRKCLPETTYPDPETEICPVCKCVEQHHGAVLSSRYDTQFCVGPNCSGASKETCCQQSYSNSRGREMGPRI